MSVCAGHEFTGNLQTRWPAAAAQEVLASRDTCTYVHTHVHTYVCTHTAKYALLYEPAHTYVVPKTAGVGGRQVILVESLVGHIV